MEYNHLVGPGAIEDQVIAVDAMANAMFLVARHEGKSLGKARKAKAFRAQLAEEAERAFRVVFGNSVADPLQIALGLRPTGERSFRRFFGAGIFAREPVEYRLGRRRPSRIGVGEAAHDRRVERREARFALLNQAGRLRATPRSCYCSGPSRRAPSQSFRAAGPDRR